MINRTQLTLVAFLIATGCAGETRSGDKEPHEEAGLRPNFSRMQEELFSDPGAQTNAWADYDGDGDLDLFVGFRNAPNRLYRNDQGSFLDVGLEAGLAVEAETRAAAWGDYDLDGDPDLYVGFGALGIDNRLYIMWYRLYTTSSLLGKFHV